MIILRDKVCVFHFVLDTSIDRVEEMIEYYKTRAVMVYGVDRVFHVYLFFRVDKNYVLCGDTCERVGIQVVDDINDVKPVPGYGKVYGYGLKNLSSYVDVLNNVVKALCGAWLTSDKCVEQNISLAKVEPVIFKHQVVLPQEPITWLLFLYKLYDVVGINDLKEIVASMLDIYFGESDKCIDSPYFNDKERERIEYPLVWTLYVTTSSFRKVREFVKFLGQFYCDRIASDPGTYIGYLSANVLPEHDRLVKVFRIIRSSQLYVLRDTVVGAYNQLKSEIGEIENE